MQTKKNKKTLRFDVGRIFPQAVESIIFFASF